MKNTPADWLPLQDILRTILLNHSDGLSEYELLKLLQSEPYSLFVKQNLAQPLVLFQTHFILFNALYHVRDYCLAEEVGMLHIDCLCIRLTPWQPGQTGLQALNKLRAYYLDWQHIEDTNQEEVETLLGNFWQGMSGLTKTTNDMSEPEALKLLNLDKLGTQQELKKQYRKMLHLHHPDKGGDTTHTRLLHQAYGCLKTRT